MIKVLVGTSNRLKVEATKEAFSRAFSEEVEVKGYQVNSGVSVQPFGDDVFKGAINRVKACSRREKADFYVGIEGGIIKKLDRLMTFAAVCIMDSKGRTSIGTSGHFPLPKEVVELIREGKELGEAMDILIGKKGIKYNEGAIGIFSKWLIDRKALYVHALLLTLIPFLSPEFEWFLIDE